jgi:hypothetical protein
MVEIQGHRGESASPGEGTRDDLLERELAKHSFETPPKSTKAAAKAFRSGLTLGDRAWALGAEAFFRAQAAAVGFERVAPGAFRASHLDAFLPGVLAHVARGRIPGSDAEAFLILTNDDSYDDMGWSVLLVDLAAAPQGFALVQTMPQGDRAVRGAMRASTDGRSLILTALDGGARDRSAAELDAFFAAACALATRPSGADSL